MSQKSLPSLFDIMSPDMPSGDADSHQTKSKKPKRIVGKKSLEQLSTLMANDAPLMVSQISHLLKKTIEQNFYHVRVVGEISGFKQAASNHCYFNLKDTDENQTALLNCFLLAHRLPHMPFQPEDGMAVVAIGKITAYSGRSSYQLVIDRLELTGEGRLLQILAQRKQKLQKEGLFDEGRKIPLPPFPKTIGVITSPTGAVIRDIIHRVRERFPCQIIVYPVLVQGQGAAADICQALTHMDNLAHPLPKPEVIIVARGGGSLEDLWTFNEEVVVRAVAQMNTPIISAIGHETDTTLIDLVADVRAPTPTAAAELALPFLLSDVGKDVANMEGRLTTTLGQMLTTKDENLQNWQRRIPSPMVLIEKKQVVLEHHASVLNTQQNYYFNNNKNKLEHLWRLLNSVSYKKTLARGFAIIKQGEEIITRKKNFISNQPTTIEFHDGSISLPPNK